MLSCILYLEGQGQQLSKGRSLMGRFAIVVQVDAGPCRTETAASTGGPQAPGVQDKENANANRNGLEVGSSEGARKGRLCLGKRLRIA